MIHVDRLGGLEVYACQHDDKVTLHLDALVRSQNFVEFSALLALF